MNVDEIMTRDVMTVTPETRLRDLARLMSERQVSGVPVVDADDRCIGVISEADLLAKQTSRPLSRRLPLEWILGERHDPEELRRRAATTVGQAMSSPAVTITPDRPVHEAATTMVERGVNRLPVVDDGRLVGIVTRSDLVRAYLRLDEHIRRAVREGVLRDTMWLDPDAFDVDVREGVVRIRGTVDRRSTAGIVERLIGITDGVAGVRSELAWEMDDTGIKPAGDGRREPGAASLTARSRPRPEHR